jgi:hypothetical protein
LIGIIKVTLQSARCNNKDKADFSCLFIYGLRDQVTRDWRKFENEELHVPYFSPNIISMKK